MNSIPISALVDGLKAIPDEDFVTDHVYEYLAKNPVAVDSLEKYFYWSPDFYTRNLVYKDERFEMLAICWEKGQASTVHDHSDQKCWMMVPIGRLRGTNFSVEEIDESQMRCKLRETETFELKDCLAAKVDLEEPIHQVMNLAEFGERAVSIHIYSQPFDRCRSYCRESDTYKEVLLKYSSIDGELCEGVSATR